MIVGGSRDIKIDTAICFLYFIQLGFFLNTFYYSARDFKYGDKSSTHRIYSIYVYLIDIILCWD